ncbi:hypothetical protein GCM10023339_18970 [Alloalcanivorax gelatiniphagus]
MSLKSLLRSTPTTVIGATVVLAGIAGTATASVATNDEAARKPAPKASVTSAAIKDGTIKKVDLGKSVKKALAAKGTVGPAGPQGAIGPAGPQGVPGPASLPQVRHHQPGGTVILDADVEELVAQVAVPAGTYYLTADATVISQGAGLGACAIVMDDANAHTAQYTFPAGTSRVPMSLGAVYTATGPDTARLLCETPADGVVLAMRITAVPVTLAG